MSILTPFIRRQERTPRAQAPPVHAQGNPPVAVAPQLPPEPIASPVPVRLAHMPKFFSFHPHNFQEDTFLFRGARIRPGAFIPAGIQAPFGHRFNVRRPIPETFGSRFELGGEQ